MALMNCPFCGKNIWEKAASCPKCGQDLSKIVKCPDCGHVSVPGTSICPECGYPFKVVSRNDTFRYEKENVTSKPHSDHLSGYSNKKDHSERKKIGAPIAVTIAILSTAIIVVLMLILYETIIENPKADDTAQIVSTEKDFVIFGRVVSEYYFPEVERSAEVPREQRKEFFRNPKKYQGCIIGFYAKILQVSEGDHGWCVICQKDTNDPNTEFIAFFDEEPDSCEPGNIIELSGYAAGIASLKTAEGQLKNLPIMIFTDYSVYEPLYTKEIYKGVRVGNISLYLLEAYYLENCVAITSEIKNDSDTVTFYISQDPESERLEEDSGKIVDQFFAGSSDYTVEDLELKPEERRAGMMIFDKISKDTAFDYVFKNIRDEKGEKYSEIRAHVSP